MSRALILLDYFVDDVCTNIFEIRAMPIYQVYVQSVFTQLASDDLLQLAMQSAVTVRIVTV